MIEKWITEKKKKVDDFKIFDLYWLNRKHPSQDKQGNFVVLDSASWVNIIPVTKDMKVVMVEQYRHGTDSLTLEVPGGLVEPGEDPRLAGQRECREETGFVSDNDAELLGEILPNPAFLNNICYSYLWLDCEEKFKQQLDGNEDIKVHLLDLKDIPEYIRSGKINHSLVMNAFFYYFLKNNSAF